MVLVLVSLLSCHYIHDVLGLPVCQICHCHGTLVAHVAPGSAWTGSLGGGWGGGCCCCCWCSCCCCCCWSCRVGCPNLSNPVDRSLCTIVELLHYMVSALSFNANSIGAGTHDRLIYNIAGPIQCQMDKVIQLKD